MYYICKVMSMDEKKVIISASDISMRFRLMDNRAGSLKEYMVRKLRGDIKTTDFWALKHISFDVYEGEVLGVIGQIIQARMISFSTRRNIDT